MKSDGPKRLLPESALRGSAGAAPADPNILTEAQVAARLQCSPRTVRRMGLPILTRRRGKLGVRYYWIDVLAHLRKHR